MIEKLLGRPAWWLHDYIAPWRWYVHLLAWATGDRCNCDEKRESDGTDL